MKFCLSNVLPLWREKPQNRHMSQFDTGATAAINSQLLRAVYCVKSFVPHSAESHLMFLFPVLFQYVRKSFQQSSSRKSSLPRFVSKFYLLS